MYWINLIITVLFIVLLTRIDKMWLMWASKDLDEPFDQEDAEDEDFLLWRKRAYITMLICSIVPILNWVTMVISVVAASIMLVISIYRLPIWNKLFK